MCPFLKTKGGVAIRAPYMQIDAKKKYLISTALDFGIYYQNFNLGDMHICPALSTFQLPNFFNSFFKFHKHNLCQNQFVLFIPRQIGNKLYTLLYTKNPFFSTSALINNV